MQVRLSHASTPAAPCLETLILDVVGQRLCARPGRHLLHGLLQRLQQVGAQLASSRACKVETHSSAHSVRSGAALSSVSEMREHATTGIWVLQGFSRGL